MVSGHSVFEPIVRDVEHDGMTFDVRCFLVTHATGLVLIDTGLPGNVEHISSVLDRVGAGWADITDIVLTHKHFDHVASLPDVVALAGDPVVWAGAEDRAEVQFTGVIRPLVSGAHVRDLRVLATPGHTPGHHSLIHDDAGLLFAGDTAGTTDGALTRGPAQFTENATVADQTLAMLASIPWERMVLAHGPEVADPHDSLERLLALGSTSHS